jgi:chorismate mutase
MFWILISMPRKAVLMRPALAVRAGALLAVVCAAGFIGSGPAGAAEPRVPATSRHESLEPLVRVAADRMLVADKVAAAKYGTALPIEDPVREQQVLDSMVSQAPGLGLDPDAVRQTFKDQIEASKLVQRQWYALWDSGVLAPPAQRPNLAELRPVIDRLNALLLTALANTRAVRAGPRCWEGLARAWQAANGHLRLDALHQVALARALPSVCTTAP